jgi:hypothetical protein
MAMAMARKSGLKIEEFFQHGNACRSSLKAGVAPD